MFKARPHAPLDSFPQGWGHTVLGVCCGGRRARACGEGAELMGAVCECMCVHERVYLRSAGAGMAATRHGSAPGRTWQQRAWERCCFPFMSFANHWQQQVVPLLSRAGIAMPLEGSCFPVISDNSPNLSLLTT